MRQCILEKTLARGGQADVTLISRENFILFTPMLHEVAAGDLSASDIVGPLRRILRYVKVAQAEVKQIDLSTRTVRCVAGLRQARVEFEFDHLLLALGSETNFFEMEDVRERAMTMKSLSDAALLRNRMVEFLEEANLQTDESICRRLLTFVVAGRRFCRSGNSGSRKRLPTRKPLNITPSIAEEMIRVVIVHPGSFLLPELGEQLGRYAERKLRERGVEVTKGLRVTSYDGLVVRLSDGTSLPASTLIWTAGVTTSEVISSLPCEKEHGRLRVDEYLAVQGATALWAVGDCAAVPDRKSGGFYPPTAQHGTREGVAAAKNIELATLGQPLKPFQYTTQGLLAAIGHHTGLAMLSGVKFSGFGAWWFWRTIYLAKLPRLGKKLGVMAAWTSDLFFGREIEQTITPRDVELLSARVKRIRKESA